MATSKSHGRGWTGREPRHLASLRFTSLKARQFMGVERRMKAVYQLHPLIL